MDFNDIYMQSKRQTSVYYEYISVPHEIVEKYSNNVFENLPKEYHITTCFKSVTDLSEHYGTKFHFKVIAYGVSEDAEAVKVVLLDKPDWLDNLKDLLHITLSFRQKAVDSNYITDWKLLEDDEVYEGTFEGKIHKKDNPKKLDGLKESKETQNIEYADNKSCELENFLTDLYKDKQIMTNHETGWQKWVRSRNPEPEKFHNKFSDAEKNGIFYGHCVTEICDGNE